MTVTLQSRSLLRQPTHPVAWVTPVLRLYATKVRRAVSNGHQFARHLQSAPPVVAPTVQDRRRAARLSSTAVELYDLVSGRDEETRLVQYEEAWDLQRRLRQRVMNQIPPPLPGGQENAVSLDGRAFLHAVVVVEHAPVYTLGTGSTSDNVLFDPDCPPYGASLVRTERGGEVTYHGPGQLVLYPILHLGEHNSSFKKDLHWYVSKLEESVILTLAEYGLSAGRKKGLIGVWVGDAKYCAIGVKVSKWVTMHGLALNVSTDMEPFSYIVPCGIHEYAVGSLNSSRHVKCNVPLHEVKQRLLHNFANVFDVTFAPPSMIW